MNTNSCKMSKMASMVGLKKCGFIGFKQMGSTMIFFRMHCLSNWICQIKIQLFRRKQ